MSFGFKAVDIGSKERRSEGGSACQNRVLLSTTFGSGGGVTGWRELQKRRGS